MPILKILAHEYGHYLYGPGHSNTAGVMSQREHASYALNAVERERLGYIAYTNCTQDNFTMTLEDFIVHGDILRVPIPVSNQNSSTFFLVENHQKLSNYDQIIRGGPINGGWDFTTDVGSGIYIWLVENGNSTVQEAHYEAVTADGRWDWAYDGDYYAGPGWAYGGYLPQTKRIAVNRNYGKTEKNPRHIYIDGEWIFKWVDINPITGQYELTRDIMGDEYDAFNLGYNEVFSPWSNPSSYVDGITNLSLQLYNQNGNNITVKVFTTSSSALNLPPSKPQNLQLAAGGPYGHTPVLTWEANIESDINNYRIYRRQSEYGSWSHIATTSNTTYSDTESIINLYGAPGWQASYKIKAVDTQNKLSVYSDIVYIEIVPAMYKKTDEIAENYKTPTEIELLPNYPNPFNPETQIRFGLPEDSRMTIEVFNLQGQKVATLADGYYEAGYHLVTFSGVNHPSGVYFYRAVADDFQDIKRMLLIK